jgi:hypothetical protein
MARQNYIPHTPTQGRANRFPVGGGGVFQNLGPLPFQGPPKKIFPESKIFPKNVGDGGGGGGGWGSSTLFFRKQKFPKYFAKQLFSRMPGPPPRKLGPPFYFFGGVLHPHTPQVARPCPHPPLQEAVLPLYKRSPLIHPSTMLQKPEIYNLMCFHYFFPR